jgi:DNA mismatch endonuclease (patch repair protein)
VADTLTPAQRSERMGRVRSKDTRPERLVRSMVHGLGYRYRLHCDEVPGRPDLVFTSRRKVIFVHGCFWHGHAACKLARLPKSNRDFWAHKIEANKRRDERVRRQLRINRWKAIVIWQCRLRDRRTVVRRLVRFLGERGKVRASSSQVGDSSSNRRK